MTISGVSTNTSSCLTELTGSSDSTGTSTTSSKSTGKVYDKKDTNKDGKVSYQEEMAYDLKHPTETKKSDVDKKTDKINELVGTIVNTTA